MAFNEFDARYSFEALGDLKNYAAGAMLAKYYSDKHRSRARKRRMTLKDVLKIFWRMIRMGRA